MVRRAVLGLLALAVLSPSTALARTRFLCDVDLLVRDTCCCPPKKAKPPAHESTMQRECCKLVKHPRLALPVAIAGASKPLAAPIAVTLSATIAVGPTSSARIAIAPRAQAPPLIRSLVSQHCALLV